MCLAIPGKVIEVLGAMAMVDVDGFEEEVNLAALGKVKPGDYVLVHAGYAVSKMSETGARELLDELYALFGAEDA